MSQKENKNIRNLLSDKFQEFLDKLQRLQTVAFEKKEGDGHLERMIDDAKKSLDDVLESFVERKNLFKQSIAQKTQLRKWKIGVLKTLFPLRLKHFISIPFIYVIVFPTIIFHIVLEIYHHITFRLYNIPRVKSNEYFIHDRHSLPYLNLIEKFNCFYCSYFNNLIRYAAEIAGRTERYWCPIKHAERIKQHHSQYPKFMGYLEAQDFREKLSKLRDFSDLRENNSQECDFVKKQLNRK